MSAITSTVLPKACFVFIPGNAPGNRIGMVELGMHGYYKTAYDHATFSEERARALVDDFNSRLKVTPQQSEAMRNGSMFGWDCPAADPRTFEEKLVL